MHIPTPDEKEETVTRWLIALLAFAVLYQGPNATTPQVQMGEYLTVTEQGLFISDSPLPAGAGFVSKPWEGGVAGHLIIYPAVKRVKEFEYTDDGKVPPDLFHFPAVPTGMGKEE